MAATRVQFAKQGTAPAYFSINESGFDRTAPKTDVNQGIEITEFANDYRQCKWNTISLPK